jgi:hypothetical protein
VLEARVAEVGRLWDTGASGTVSVGRNAPDPTLKEILKSAAEKSTKPRVEGENGLAKSIREGYAMDKLFCKVMEQPSNFGGFSIRNGFLYSKSRMDEDVLCIPRMLHGKRSIPEIIITEAHEVLGHFGSCKMAEYVRRNYWWPTMVADIAKFCATCSICQVVKTSNQQLQGLLHPMPVPHQPWESIGMDFVGPFPESRGFDYLWVVICRLTSMVHLIPVNITIKASELAYLFLAQIMWLHGMPSSIVSDRDSKFTSKFWQELH